MRGILVHQQSGRFAYYGRVEDKTALWDQASGEPKEGYLLLPGTTPLPQEDLTDPVWDGSNWVKGPEQLKREQTEETRGKTLEKLRAKRRDGKKLTASELQTLLDHLLGV